MVGWTGVRAHTCSSGAPPRSRAATRGGASPPASWRSRLTNFFDYCAADCQFRRPTERLGNSGRPFVRAVHDEAPVHDESDADRSASWVVGAKSEVENSGIKGRCLPRGGWKVENVGPLVTVGQQFDQPLLPREGIVAVYGAKVLREMEVSQFHAQLCRARQRPSPTNRPAPRSTGPSTSSPKSITAWKSDLVAKLSGTRQRVQGGLPR